MILRREGHGVIIYKMNFSYLDYLEQIIKFYFSGGSDPICVYNCVHVGGVRTGGLRGGRGGVVRGGRGGREGGGVDMATTGRVERKLPEIIKSMVMKINTP